MEKLTLKIDGMSCGHCKNAVERLLSQPEGVINAEVNLSKGEAVVNFDASSVSIEELKKLINESGMYIAS